MKSQRGGWMYPEHPARGSLPLNTLFAINLPDVVFHKLLSAAVVSVNSVSMALH